MIEKSIKRIVQRLWPELSGNLHLPIWGRIDSEPLAIAEGSMSEATSPRYAVDVQVLSEDGQPNADVPIFKEVPLPANCAGNLRGLYGFPPKGTLVEIGFILGLPSKPFVRNVLVEGLALPELGEKDMLIMQSEQSFQRCDSDGNWARTTTSDIVDKSLNLSEEIEEIRSSIAGLKQRVEVKSGGTVYVGDESNNVLQLLSDLIAIVQDLATSLSSHTHAGVLSGGAATSPPVQSSSIAQAGTQAGSVKAKLDPMVE